MYQAGKTTLSLILGSAGDKSVDFEDDAYDTWGQSLPVF